MTVRAAGRLEKVHPDLVRLVMDVGSARDIFVVQGSRLLAEEEAAILAGRSALKDPKHSKHVIVPGFRELAEAVDLAPYPVNWMDIPAFKDLGAFVKERAGVLGIAIKWGGDWVSLHDYDHVELA